MLPESFLEGVYQKNCDLIIVCYKSKNDTNCAKKIFRNSEKTLVRNL